jgi:hypothetical protein
MAMSSKGLIVLAAVTLASVAAAAVATHQRAAVTASGGGEPVLPGLIERINEVATIRVEGGAGPLTLVRRDERWTVAEKGGYPARFETVKTALVALARLTTIEAKTAKPELYGKLDVEDPGATGAKSAKLSLLDADGATLASIIVGKTRDSAIGVGRTGVYVRKAGEARAWLAEGDPKLPAEAVGWLERGITNIDRRRVATATLSQPDGSTLEIRRDDADRPDFTLVDLPQGHKVKNQFSLNSIAHVPESLDFDDVRPAGDVDFSRAATARFTTFDGMTLEFTLVETDGAAWVRIAAGAAADAADEVRREVEALEARTEGWAFRLPAPKIDKLKTARSELIAPAGS